jgi:hypothetical protein
MVDQPEKNFAVFQGELCSPNRIFKRGNPDFLSITSLFGSVIERSRFVFERLGDVPGA